MVAMCYDALGAAHTMAVHFYPAQVVMEAGLRKWKIIAGIDIPQGQM